MNVPTFDKEPKAATCPHCGTRPITLNQVMMTFPNGVVVSILNCVDCGVVIPHQVIGMKAPEKQKPTIIS